MTNGARLAAIMKSNSLKTSRVVVAIIAWVALSILAVLGRAVYLNRDSRRSTEDALAVARLEYIAYKILSYRHDQGSWPDPALGLEVFLSREAAEPPGESAHVDPWDSPYRYLLTSGGFRVVSAGRDGEHGTDDDVMAEGRADGTVRVRDATSEDGA